VGEDKKIAAYICQGCDIGKSLDIEALKSNATEEHPVEICKDLPWLCGSESLDVIRDDIKDGINSVIIAACSPRCMKSVFDFENCFTTRVNLREHVVWSHEPDNEDTQMLAEDYLRMGIAKAGHGSTPEPFTDDVSKDLLVVGGGVSGMSAALEAAKAGYQVHLVEKEDRLGGWVAKSHKSFPTAPPYAGDLPSGCVGSVVSAIEEHERIQVYLSSTIEKISGQPGQYDVSLKNGNGGAGFRAGAVVQATGWKPYDASNLGHLGYGKSPNVVTNVQMEEMAATGAITRPSDGKPAKRIAFIQCAGSRDQDHLPYCSAVCCRVSLKQAIYVRECNPDAEVYVLYKDIRSPGQAEDFYKHVQNDPNVYLTKGDVIGVEALEDDTLRIDVENTLLDPKIQVEADLVVLATGMVPNAADGEALRALTDAKGIIAKGEEGGQLNMAKETEEKYRHLEGTEILNLDYRQGPDLPNFKYGFPDSHYICFPFETRRTGIYASGCLRAPNDATMCKEDGAGAALKAIQCVELASQGAAVHPRWDDQSFPDFAMQRCTKCKRCTEECPFGTLNEDAEGTPQPNPLRCRRCGICLGACPERIISFQNYNVGMMSAMVKSVEIPDEDEEKPRIIGFLCENDAYPALDTAGLKRLKHSAYIRFISVRCLGAVNIIWINDALSSGFDGVLLVGCKSGDDYQCHFIRGSELMGTRGENVQEKLQQLALESERVRMEEIAITDHDRLVQIIEEFAEEIEEVGPNPFKGF